MCLPHVGYILLVYTPSMYDFCGLHCVFPRTWTLQVLRNRRSTFIGHKRRPEMSTVGGRGARGADDVESFQRVQQVPDRQTTVGTAGGRRGEGASRLLVAWDEVGRRQRERKRQDGCTSALSYYNSMWCPYVQRTTALRSTTQWMADLALSLTLSLERGTIVACLRLWIEVWRIWIAWVVVSPREEHIACLLCILAFPDNLIFYGVLWT